MGLRGEGEGEKGRGKGRGALNNVLDFNWGTRIIYLQLCIIVSCILYPGIHGGNNAF